MSDTPIRVLIADDHALVREGIRRVLDEDPGFDVVAEAADGRQAIARVGETEPDVAILDISMPELSGLEAARRLRDEFPALKILILSMHDAVFKGGVHFVSSISALQPISCRGLSANCFSPKRSISTDRP